jgi:hypothetical protein
MFSVVVDRALVFISMRLHNDNMREKLNFVLKWGACAVTLAGAVCTALQLMPINIYVLNLGALLYLVWSIRIREWNLILVNAALLIIYLAGFVITFFQ